jgi:hypothetical protein
MYSPRQLADPVIRARLDADRRETMPTPLWHLAKSANIAEKDMLHHLGTLGISVFCYGADQERHITKADARKLIGIEGAE